MAPASENVHIVSNEAEWKALLASEQPVLVDFTATWCGPCQMIAPYFAELADAFKGKVVFVKVDVDANEDIAAAAGITAMPTFQLYKAGQKVETFCGAARDKLKDLVERHAA